MKHCEYCGRFVWLSMRKHQQSCPSKILDTVTRHYVIHGVPGRRRRVDQMCGFVEEEEDILADVVADAVENLVEAASTTCHTFVSNPGSSGNCGNASDGGDGGGGDGGGGDGGGGDGG